MKSKFLMGLVTMFACHLAWSEDYHCVLSNQGKEKAFVAAVSDTPYDLGEYKVTMPPCGYASVEEKSSGISASAYDLTYSPKEVFLSLSTPTGITFLSCYLE